MCRCAPAYRKRARIGVLTPGPADGIALFIDGEIGVAALEQLDRCEHAGHAGANDDCAQAGRLGLVGHVSTPIGRLGAGYRAPACSEKHRAAQE